MTATPNFHISLPCENVDLTRDFYVNELGFSIGREAANWVDINLFGNQLTFAESKNNSIATQHYLLDNQRLPLFHIGVILNHDDWKEMLEKLSSKPFLEINKSVFLHDQVGEHSSFFVLDPNGYYLEFKTFTNLKEIFQK